MTTTIQFFDRPCCGPSAAVGLADFLRQRLDPDAVVEVHNLNEGGSTEINVPAAVIAHLSGNSALPVMAVDGRLVAAGTLPNLMDALDLATGKAPAQQDATRSLPTIAPATANKNCC